MQHFTQSDFAKWERFYRANLLSSLSGFKATHLVATSNAAGISNLSLFHSVVHLGADPALIGMVNCPLAATPHTLANIEATGMWTMNSVHPAILQKAHQWRIRRTSCVFLRMGDTAKSDNGASVKSLAGRKVAGAGPGAGPQRFFDRRAPEAA